ncbi:potassium channel subfamily k [Holotrichia oblita]|uniref:Potassium channel subfamily k n=1 Tax=Holotrichia oblita TaxID=644536 RepID=A0ACB9SK69_HOLOL|nr:potassium channel subfamily k [Holotrichia oblita]
MNSARAQKLNKFIAEDHFSKLKQVFRDNDIFGKPVRLFNLDEKGCGLNLHKDPKVLRVQEFTIGNEYGENVTVVSCANAIGSAMPPMILFKDKRMKPEFADDLPPGSVCRMTEKGSMIGYTILEATNLQVAAYSFLMALHLIRHMNYNLWTKRWFGLLNTIGISR